MRFFVAAVAKERIAILNTQRLIQNWFLRFGLARYEIVILRVVSRNIRPEKTAAAASFAASVATSCAVKIAAAVI